MPAKVTPGPISEDASIREAVCVHTRKIFDSCRDKDCIEDLRFYPTLSSLPVIENAVSVRSKSAELLFVSTDVEEMTFNRGYYTIDIRYFYKIKGEAFTLLNSSCEICGLAVFDKRVILFGSEGNAKIFSSDTVLGKQDISLCKRTNLPTAVVEAVDPIVLDMKLVEVCSTGIDTEGCEVPSFITGAFEDSLSLDNTDRRIYVTLGQFSIVRLERDTQLLIPAYDYCMPEKECVGSGDNDPCALFSRIDFPVDEFFPPDSVSTPECYKEVIAGL